VRAIRWLLTIVSGVCTALVACFIDVNVKALNKLKYDATYGQIVKRDDGGLWGHLWGPLFTFVGISVGFTLIPGLLVSFVEPVARGSGIPEIKCYLNGVKIPRVVRFLTLITKAIGVLFSVAGGLPVGKEGPMIHSGSVVAAGLSQGKSSSLGLDTSWTKFHPFRNDHEKRDFVACGAAAGVAAAFGAPVGGALFALEEGTTHWNDFLTWRTFVCAMVSGFTLQIVLSSEGQFGKLSQQGMITFGSFASEDRRYSVQDVALFLLLGILGGVLGAGFNEVNKLISIKRKKHIAPYP
jgi:chloride channel 7